MKKVARRREIKVRKSNTRCPTQVHFLPSIKNNAYFTNLETKHEWENKNNNHMSQICHEEKNLFYSNEFWIRPYEGTFCKFISIHAFGLSFGFGQQIHLPAPLPYQPHQRGKVTWRIWPYLYSEGREVFSSLFLIPKILC